MHSQTSVRPPHQPRLLDQLRDAIRRKHYSYRTEKTYLHWVRRYIRHPFADDRSEYSHHSGIAGP